MTTLRSFFDAWQRLEATHPFGVVYFYSMFTEHGVPAAMAGDVDEYLFLDLVNTGVDVRRFKVAARITGESFWVYLDLRTCVLSFQATPATPFTYTVPIAPSPTSLIGFVLAYYRGDLLRPLVFPSCGRRHPVWVRRAQ
jgi:hypothetical protein